MRIPPITAALLVLALPALALDGQGMIHDPSALRQCDGKYYTYGTGGTTQVSDDGRTWRRGVNPARSGMVVNGGGATDFCARFLGSDDKPLTSLTVNLTDAK